MKTLILILIFSFTQVIAQDTSIVKYLPLKTGNIWIYTYSGSSGSGKMKMIVTGTIINNGHNYYTMELVGNPCGCSFNSYSPFLFQLSSAIRIDSVTGNVYANSPGACGWNPNENLIDSLKMSPIMMVNNSCYTTSCQDTNDLNIFGGVYKTKYVGLPIMTYYKFRRYTKNLGLTNSLMGCYAGTTCGYTLQGCIINGTLYGDTSFPVGINLISTEIPDKFNLGQNYPNPFNPKTNITFSVPASGFVKLTIFDAVGKEVEVLLNRELKPGIYEADWDASSYPSGVYYYKLESGDFTETKKMVLIK